MQIVERFMSIFTGMKYFYFFIIYPVSHYSRFYKDNVEKGFYRLKIKTYIKTTPVCQKKK